MKFLQGSYGVDLLSLILIMISSILNLFGFTRIIALIILCFAIYRSLSKKIYKRKEEYNLFLLYANKFLKRFGKSIPYNLPTYDLNNLSIYYNNILNKFNDFRKYKITQCPNCKQKLRLPRGKGKIVVTCKKCYTKFDFRT